MLLTLSDFQEISDLASSDLIQCLFFEVSAMSGEQSRRKRKHGPWQTWRKQSLLEVWGSDLLVLRTGKSLTS